MYKKRDPLLFIDEVIESINDIKDYTKEMDYGHFLADKKTQHATIRCFQVIGEAMVIIVIFQEQTIVQLEKKELFGII